MVNNWRHFAVAISLAIILPALLVVTSAHAQLLTAPDYPAERVLTAPAVQNDMPAPEQYPAAVYSYEEEPRMAGSAGVKKVSVDNKPAAKTFRPMLTTGNLRHEDTVTGGEYPWKNRIAEAQMYRQTKGTVEVQPQAYQGDSQNAPVDLSADHMQHDDANQVITASGNVELVQNGRILRADTITYNLQTDTVVARGNVVLSDTTGDVHFADEVRLTDKMQKGFVQGLQTYLSDGGQFSATEGHRKSSTLLTLHNAAYTPCDCEEDEDGDPAWQIRADELTYDEEAHRISYKNARFEIFGVPVAYTPYWAHPDGKVKRKSGFLSPQVGYDSDLGITVTENYYWDMAPNRDLTAGVMLTTREVPVGLLQYRHRFEQAELQIDTSATYSQRADSIGGLEVITDEEYRGHVFADGKWDINDKWRSGFNVEVTTDDQYLRQYDFSSKDVLENELYVERFSGRNYGVGRLLAFQDLRVGEDQTDQPNVLPEIMANFLGEPGQTLGGRWELEASTLGLQRSDGQDMTRLITKAGWQRRFVADAGLVTTIEGTVRGDAYYVYDRDVATAGSGRSKDSEETRVFARAHAVTSYPMVRDFEKVQAVIEPTVALTLSPNIDSEDTDIPNEDSQDVQLDASNLFEPNRFPGEDRIEDRSHVTYGARTGIYGHKGSHADIFVGQSIELDSSNNPFPEGSGLSRQESDFVGQITASYEDDYTLSYRFQLDSHDVESRRHELDAYAKIGRISLDTRYLYASQLEGTDIDESREQVHLGAAYRLTNHWQVRGSALEDLGENPGLRKATFGIDYLGCCMSFSIGAERNLTSDTSGDSGTDVTFRIGLKGLGGFESARSGGWGASN